MSSTPLSDPTLEISAQLLTQQYGVPLDAARARMSEEPALIALSGRLAAAAGPSWSGSWFDQANGGQLVAMATDTKALASALASEPLELRSVTQVRQASYSLASLNRANAALDAALRSDRLLVSSVATRVETNSLTVLLPSAQTAQAQGVDPAVNHAAAAARASAAGVPFDIVESGGLMTQHSCMPVYEICDKPLRGGIEIQYDDTATGLSHGCTGGLNVISKSDGKPYLITAGHCGGLGYNWYTDFADGGQHTIGVKWSGTSNFPTDDSEIISVPNASGWLLPHQSHVLVTDYTGTRSATRNESYAITALGSAASLPANTYLCYTGSTTGTECLQYIGTYGNSYIMQLVDVGFGPCQGDSGGPLYLAHVAYAIDYGSTADQASHTGAFRYLSPGVETVDCTHKDNSTDFAWEYFSSLTVAFANRNVQLSP